ncbi:PREDICTED: beclin-2-like [Galeopterus variegatus]|uniref:Beclin-2-like n=1 Tax=Galeopterus variegatus TaxID=482537 RepID=A0ABM0R7C6_GALVR|nr:PREDICTED: beclin-2-like [Galeopterus variegatus]
MSSIRFVCQHCSQPLKVSRFLETLGHPAAGTVAPAQGGPGDTQEDGATCREEMDIQNLQAGPSGGPPADGGRMSRVGADNFTLLGEIGSLRIFSSIHKAAGEIFDILSGQRDVDHPLCEECTDTLFEQLDAQLTATELASQDYRRCLDTSKQVGQEALQTELGDLQQEEARMARELQDVDVNLARAAAELQAAQAETAELQQRERQVQMDCMALEWQHLELQDQLRSVDNQLRHARDQLHQLQKIDVFNATFKIWEEGPLGVINNFRLGCLPTVPVSWNEINAAWGQTALLLLSLSNAIGLQFQRYSLVPCGNHSYLRSLPGGSTELPLFCCGGRGVFWGNRFDRAMRAFLDCMQQFKEEAGKGEQGLCLPYKIHVDKGLLEDAGGSRECYSITTLLNTEERWTQALRLMLLNLKWSLTWVSSKYHPT